MSETKLKKSDFGWAMSDPNDSFDELVEVIRKKFGIQVYSDPYWDGNSDFAFIVSKEKLGKRQILEVSKLFNKELYEEDEADMKREEEEDIAEKLKLQICPEGKQPIYLGQTKKGKK